MIFKKSIIKLLFKLLLPEIVKLLKPIKKYVDEPNELDDMCRKLDSKMAAASDIIVDVGKTVNTVEEDLNNFKRKADKGLAKIKQLEEAATRTITLQAMVDKFDRDQDYLDQKVKDISSIINTLTMFKGDK
tara:strand:+ start:124 stop:516 length:393 start_codon:yes stop_codon:yes gene_type:complete